ncbi:MAG: ParB/RepB/Spo0J family partition protein, partial [Verrucomicrobia bacterium]|nr:ParB/RepB/Spo0J family partition protein [Verrucomicrobiota bacterium]
RLAGLEEVPVLVKPNADQSALEWMMVENLQREDLNPLEEARGYHELSQKFKLKQDEIARKVGKSRAAVANSMRLLKLPSSVQDMLWRGDISVGHAKVLLGISREEDVQKAAMRAFNDRLSVRQLEEMLQRWQKAATPGGQSPPPAAGRCPQKFRNSKISSGKSLPPKSQSNTKMKKGASRSVSSITRISIASCRY